MRAAVALDGHAGNWAITSPSPLVVTRQVDRGRVTEGLRVLGWMQSKSLFSFPAASDKAKMLGLKIGWKWRSKVHEQSERNDIGKFKNARPKALACKRYSGNQMH